MNYHGVSGGQGRRRRPPPEPMPHVVGSYLWEQGATAMPLDVPAAIGRPPTMAGPAPQVPVPAVFPAPPAIPGPAFDAPVQEVIAPPVPQRPGSHHRHDHRLPPIPAGWSLPLILAVQAAASVRLLRADTASPDEAISLWAGHLLWAHWLHGAPVPPFQAYLSGAPVAYPTLGVLAGNVAGLTGARILSLVFMLGATALLWGTASRLFSHRAAFFAAALFALAGPTLGLGAFATGDAMSVFGVALAAWCVARAGTRGDATGLMIVAGVALALANATAYWSALFDPIVLAATLLIAYPKPGGKQAVGRAATLLTVLATLVTVGTLAGGAYYVTGVHQALSLDVTGMNPAVAVLRSSGLWLGVIAGAAVCGVVIGAIQWRARARTWLVALLAAAVFVVPVEQAGLRTALSLSSHVVLGAWFAAVAAGFAVDALITAVPRGWTRATVGAACVVALALPVSLGAGQSRSLATSWPNATTFLSLFGPLANHSHGHLLVEDPQVAQYYLSAGGQWQRWSTTRNIVLPSGTSIDIINGGHQSAGGNGPREFAHYIASGYFSLVALNFTDTTVLDHTIEADLKANHHYHVLYVVPYGPSPYVVWQYWTSRAPQPYEPRLTDPKPTQHHRGRG